MYGGEEKCIHGFGGEKPEEKRTLRRPRRRWEDNIDMDCKEELGWDGVDWIDLAEDMDKWQAFVNMVMKLQVP
jgi:hypothetical protein